jgi:outer membrane protein OmpA-like peptidoglycan-associated protein
MMLQGHVALASCIVAAAAACTPATSSSDGAALNPEVASDTSLFFTPSSARLTAEAESVVSAVAEEAKAANSSTVVVTGHANAAEGRTLGKELARERATAVERELINQGVPGHKVQTSSSDGAAATIGVEDRRVDIQVVSPSRSQLTKK